MPKTKAKTSPPGETEPEYIFSEDNSLSPIGEKIFLDRYALKDGTKQGIKMGNTVVVNTDLKTGRREIGVVKGIVDKNVTVELRDGTMVERLLEHVDVPIETKPTEMMSRIAKGIASVETTPENQAVWEQRFRWLLDGYKFVPAGRILTTAGSDQKLTCYNCFVIPSPQDSRGGILQTLGQMNEIFSRGGGVGINLSSLRPRYSYVKGVNGRSSGSVSWGSLYSYSTGLIEQGGCLMPDTLVNTKDGLLRLDEIVTHKNPGWKAGSQTIMTDEGERQSRQVYNNGQAETLAVTTDTGLSLTGTPNHKVKIMTDGGPAWRQLSELKSGDAILVKMGQHQGSAQTLKQPTYVHHNQDHVSLPTVLNKELAFFLGYFTGDGFSTKKASDWRIGVSIAHSSYLMEEMPQLVERLFPGVNARFQQKENDASAILVISNRAVKEFLQINGLDKEKSLLVKVPRLIRQSPPAIVGAYLRGLFEADGGLSHRYPSLSSISERLVKETAALLIGLSCPIRIDKTEPQDSLGDNPKWRVRITSHRGLLAWQKLVGCDERSRFAACLDFQPDLTRETSYVLPEPAYWVEPVLSGITEAQIDGRATGLRFKATDQPLRRSLLRYRRGDRNLTISAYDSSSQTHSEFAKHAPAINNTWFAFVKSVAPAGIHPTLDLEVDGNHTYLANGLVTHNSRRGALMLVLNDWHPDVLEFIGSKREAGKISNANISVGISDKFMAAVKADGNWDLVFPDTSDPDYDQTWDGNLDAWLKKGKKVNTYKTLKAREIWHALIESAWASAEPGVFFNERYNKLSNSWYYAPIICTNPCVTGDTLVATDKGYVKAKDMKVGMKIKTPKGFKAIDKVYNNGVQRIWKIKFSDGGELKCTADHKLKVVREKKYEWIKITDLEIGDKVLVGSTDAFGNKAEAPKQLTEYIDKSGLRLSGKLDRELGLLTGIVLGDGCFRQVRNRNSYSYQCKVAFGTEEQGWQKAFAGLLDKIGMHHHASLSTKSFALAPAPEPVSLLGPPVMISVDSKTGATLSTTYKPKPRSAAGTIITHQSLAFECYKLATVMSKLGMEPNVRAPQKSLPKHLLESNREFLLGVLDGLFSTDGSVLMKQDNPMLRFHTSSKAMANQVRLILLQFGIQSRIYKQTRDASLRYDGRSMVGTGLKYDLVITNEGIRRFAEVIGLTNPDKAARLNDIAENWHCMGSTWTTSVTTIEDTGKDEEVFDVHEPETLTWLTNGYYSFDCGEQGLPGWGVCNLGAINLAQFVDDEAHDVAWEKLRQAIQYAVRFLDNVIDWTPYFFEENERQQKGERRVGLNTMGLAEMMVRLGIRYGSEESTAFIDRLYRFLAGAAYSTSASLAEEKGAFPWFEADKFLESGYMKEMPKEIRQIVKDKGIRNVTLLTQAPNGTIGTMVGTSTGIEPFYSWTYFRTSRLGTHEEKVEIVQNWLKDHPDEELPSYFVTAMELTPEEHVAVQAAIQRWVDTSISKTCNTPESYTVEETQRLFELLYDMGAKGGTIYRDKSRDTQVLNTEKQDENKAVNNDTGSSDYSSGDSDSTTAVINIGDSTSVKSIQSAQEEFRIKPRVRPAVISGSTEEIKTGMGSMFVTINEDPHGPFEVFATIGKSGSETMSLTEALGRLISVSLRSGIEIKTIIHHLSGIRGSAPVWQNGELILSVPDAIAKALERFIDRKNSLGLTETAAQNGGQPTLELTIPAEAKVEIKEEAPIYATAPSHTKEKAEATAEVMMCPECGGTMARESGCATCNTCGYSRCG